MGRGRGSAGFSLAFQPTCLLLLAHQKLCHVFFFFLVYFPCFYSESHCGVVVTHVAGAQEGLQVHGFESTLQSVFRNSEGHLLQVFTCQEIFFWIGTIPICTREFVYKADTRFLFVFTAFSFIYISWNRCILDKNICRVLLNVISFL